MTTEKALPAAGLLDEPIAGSILPHSHLPRPAQVAGEPLDVAERLTVAARRLRRAHWAELLKPRRRRRDWDEWVRGA